MAHGHIKRVSPDTEDIALLNENSVMQFLAVVASIVAIAAAPVDPYAYHRGHTLKNCPQAALHQRAYYHVYKHHKVASPRKTSQNRAQYQSVKSSHGSSRSDKPSQGAYRSDKISQAAYPSDKIDHYRSDKPKQGSYQPGFDIDEMLRQVNRVRAKVGAQPLRIHQSLMQAARHHSQDQASSRRMTHTGSNGSDHSSRCRLAGYNGRGTAENVAYNQRSVTRVMTAWIHSPGHYQNLVNPKYKEFGAGMVNFHWTQNFGSQSE